MNQEAENYRKTPFDIKEPFKSGFLKVSEIHTIYWEVSGNPEGKPAIIIHGGPGGQSNPKNRGFFNPEIFMIVQFDQRGCGKSTPFAVTEENTTQDLIKDIETIRDLLKIEVWHTVFGGSWGSTLAIFYAETYPQKVQHLILRGIFTGGQKEMEFFYQNGTNWIFPDYYENFYNALPEVKRNNLLHNYHQLFNSDINEETKKQLAIEWTKYEGAISYFKVPDDYWKEIEEDQSVLSIAKLESHYFANGCFFEKENQLIEDAHLISHIPTIIVNGRYDIVTPLKIAWDLHKKIKNSKLVIVPDAGHLASEPGIQEQLIIATQKFEKN
ncbi:hypothetical protein ABPG74_008433 [Tetrahymena malaccensis]